jgi:hypothetical protein
MKKLTLILFVFTIHYSFAQTLPDYDNIPLGNAAECKAAENAALQAANCMLSTPSNANDANRLQSLQFIIKWMTATPDYSFDIDETVGKLMNGNDDLLGLYMACMTKYSLEHSAEAKDKKIVKLNSVRLLLAYAEQGSNNFKMTKNLKKLSEANKKGELESAL